MKNIKLEAKTPNQQKYLDSIKQNQITFCDGPAGTGKTFLSTLYGIYGLINKEFEKVIISRPLVQADSPTGYLPGTIDEKLAPYIRPVIDILEQSVGKTELEKLLSAKKIEVIPFGYMRGLTFYNSFIILEECQNCSFEQLILGLTRLGKKSKMVISGDGKQSDLLHNKQGGMSHLMTRLSDISGVGLVYFDNTDIIREPIIKRILERLDEKTAEE